MLGQYLDPVADKLLLSTIFVVLTHKNLIPTTITVLVFGRDLGILAVAALLYAAVGRREFKPSLFGKANTVAQVTAVAVVLLHQIYSPNWVLALAHGGLGRDGRIDGGIRPSLCLDGHATDGRSRRER